MKLFQAGMVSVALMMVPVSAIAAPSDDVLQAMGKCGLITDNAERLSCYDQLAPRVKEALAKPPEKLDHPPTKEEQESWFGFNIGSLFGTDKPTTPQEFGKERTVENKAEVAAVKEEVSSISSKVAEFAYTPLGRFVVFLDNGQVWRQIDGDSERAIFKKNGDNSVVVSRGILGSYNLSINGSAKIFKVTRVK
ncbi:MAG: hypothetical protein GC166_07595 [Alphaproteobacteria bacterium]|nr:hypothetical protein [Alphaproteobacteria bacterium]